MDRTSCQGERRRRVFGYFASNMTELRAFRRNKRSLGSSALVGTTPLLRRILGSDGWEQDEFLRVFWAGFMRSGACPCPSRCAQKSEPRRSRAFAFRWHFSKGNGVHGIAASHTRVGEAAPDAEGPGNA